MGIFNRLFGSDAKPPAAQAQVPLPDHWGDIEVAGESYRRDSIARIFYGIGRPEGGVTMQYAYLVPEPSNPYDKNAVRVIVNDEHVGYIPAEISKQVAASCAQLGRNTAVFAPTRMWARVDDGTWRARVTLTPRGNTEPEQDFAAQRHAAEAAEAERAAERDRKTAEREARQQVKTARLEAGTVRGQYWTTWKPAIAELKRQQRLEEARDFLLECRDAADRESEVAREVAEPWPSEQLAAVLRRLGDREGELQALERYVTNCGDREVPATVVARVTKARLAAERR